MKLVKRKEFLFIILYTKEIKTLAFKLYPKLEETASR